MAATGTPAGDLSVGGSSGTAGGGNTADGSTGAVQAGGLSAAPALSFDAAAPGTVGGVTPTAGATAASSASVAGADAGASGSTTTASAPASAAREPSARLGVAREPSGGRRIAGSANPSGRGAHAALSTPLQVVAKVAGTLPFTGLDLALYAILGLALAAAGLRLRVYAAR